MPPPSDPRVILISSLFARFPFRYRNTDIACESVFGALKYNQGTAVNMSAESANAMTMALRNHLFGKPGAALAPKRLPRRVRRNASSKRHKVRRNDKHDGGRLAARGAIKPAMSAAARRRVRDGTAKAECDADIASSDAVVLGRRNRDKHKRLEQQTKALLAADKWLGVVRITTLAELAARGAARPSLATKCETAKKQIQHLCEFLQCTVLGQHGAVSDDVTLHGAGRHLFITQAKSTHVSRYAPGMP